MENSIYPCLWFKGNAKEAASFYCSVFDDSEITTDTSLVVIFESSGQKFMCLNGNHEAQFNPSISFFNVCEEEQELDKAWDKLSAGGKVLMELDEYPWSKKYGWVQDQYGVNWQLSVGKLEDVGQKFTPSLMFTGPQFGKAEQAIHFYTSIFEHSDIVGIMKYTKEDHDEEGKVKHAQFSLGNSVFMAMDSSLEHQSNFNESISLVVTCNTQEEIDYYWNKLTEGGEESNCGWLKDKWGVSWQIVPAILGELMSNSERAPKVMQAFMKMKKFDIEKLVTA